MFMDQTKNFEDFIGEVEGLLSEIKGEQKQIKNSMEKYHKVNMQKFAKIREFNEISDMTNQIFERRISNIERTLSKILEKI